METGNDVTIGDRTTIGDNFKPNHNSCLGDDSSAGDNVTLGLHICLGDDTHIVDGVTVNSVNPLPLGVTVL